MATVYDFDIRNCPQVQGQGQGQVQGQDNQTAKNDQKPQVAPPVALQVAPVAPQITQVAPQVTQVAHETHSVSSSQHDSEYGNDLRSANEIHTIKNPLYYHYFVGGQKKYIEQIGTIGISSTSLPRCKLLNESIVNLSAHAFPHNGIKIYDCNGNVGEKVCAFRKKLPMNQQMTYSFMSFVDLGVRIWNIKNGKLPGDNLYREPDMPFFNFCFGCQAIQDIVVNKSCKLFLVDPNEYVGRNMGTSGIYENLFDLSDMYKTCREMVKKQIQNEPKYTFTGIECDFIRSIAIVFRHDTFVEGAIKTLPSSIHRVDMYTVECKYNTQTGTVNYFDRANVESFICNLLNTPSLFTTIASVYGVAKFGKLYVILDMFSAWAYTIATLIMALVHERTDIRDNLVFVQVFKNRNPAMFTFNQIMGLQ